MAYANRFIPDAGFEFILPHVYSKNPEFNGLEEHVWEYLNNIGQSIPAIETRHGKKYGGASDQLNFRASSIWHNKTDLDVYVAKKLGLNLDAYGQKSENKLYKATANAIRDLRRRNILIDWGHTGKSHSGVGMWRLDKTKLDKFVANTAKDEIKAPRPNFHAHGDARTVYVRTKQNMFKKALLSEYCRCALCGFGLEKYMIGAHIYPYSKMRDREPKNAMNPSNGLLLCRMCDVAFEWCNITVEPDLGVEVSDALADDRNETMRKWIGSIVPQIKVRKNAKYPPNPKYLRWKRDLC